MITQLVTTKLLEADVNITPNTTAVPGLSTLSSLMGSVMTFGLVLAFGGLVACAVMMAVGHHSGNPQVASRGKSGLVWCLLAALLIGGSNLLINTFFHLGSTLK
ncbi:MAG: hypothetical protein HIU57_05435 [Acidobacteria bacterium]|nr:hypothetical protein [Acidobacteriota bacterium]